MPRQTQYYMPLNSERKFYSDFLENSYSFLTSSARSRVVANTPNFSRRKFGIEIEAFGMYRADVANLLNGNDIPCEVESYNHSTRNHWKVVTDSSINWPEGASGESFELVSPILSGAEGIALVVRVIDLLRKNGAQVNDTCGIHIHVDVRNTLTLATLQIINRRFAAWEEHLDFFFSKNRRGNKNRFCQSELNGLALPDEDSTNSGNVFGNRYPFVQAPKGKRIDEFAWMYMLARKYMHVNPRLVDLADLDTLYDHCQNNFLTSANFINSFIQNSFSDRYRKLNFRSYIQHGTVEFRQLEGTLDSDKVAAWIDFCTSFISESILLSASYLEADGLSTDSPSRYDYFLKQLKDHPFSGMENNDHVMFMLRKIKSKNRASFVALNQAIKEKNELPSSLAERKKIYCKILVTYPSMKMLTRLKYKGRATTDRNSNKIVTLFDDVPNNIDLSEQSVEDLMTQAEKLRETFRLNPNISLDTVNSSIAYALQSQERRT